MSVNQPSAPVPKKSSKWAIPSAGAIGFIAGCVLMAILSRAIENDGGKKLKENANLKAEVMTINAPTEGENRKTQRYKILRITGPEGITEYAKVPTDKDGFLIITQDMTVVTIAGYSLVATLAP